MYLHSPFATKSCSSTEIIEHIDLSSEVRSLTLRELLKEEEKRIITQTLIQCGGNRKKAMEQLGVSKAVFYKKLKEHGIEDV